MWLVISVKVWYIDIAQAFFSLITKGRWLKHQNKNQVAYVSFVYTSIINSKEYWKY